MSNPRVGSRSGKYGSKGTKNAPETFLSMLYLGASKWTLHMKPGREDEVGPDIILAIKQMGRYGNLNMNLTDLTHAELVLIKELFNEALDWAMPVAEQRDSEALDEFNRGNDFFERVYRAVPSVVYRKRPSDEHRKGIFKRPESVPVESGDEQRPDSGDGRASAELAEPDETIHSTQDSRPTPSLPPSVPSLDRPTGTAG